MSDSAETPEAAPLREVKIRLTDEAIMGAFRQREALGFHSENAVMALGVTALAGVPPAKFFEVLAKIQAYHRTAPKGAKR